MSDCAICLQSIDDPYKKKLDCNCNYIYHTNCINRWLRENPSCPTCRKQFTLPRPTPPPNRERVLPRLPSTNNVSPLHQLSTNNADVVPYNSSGLVRGSGSLGFAPYN
jgi:hypothetical protein